MENKGALAGIKVIDLSRLLPGPYCSMILADHGARVIAVEDKRFMADGLFLSTVYRNKEHMSLDLKTEEGKKVFFELIQDADVVMEGFRPGVAKRLGVDYESLSGINPRIVYCAITGYGQDGPFVDKAGHDVNYLSYAGVLDQIGYPDRPPAIPGVQIADIAGGGMNGALGIMMALFARERTGKGQYVDISMTDCMVGLLPVSLFMYQLLGMKPERAQTMLSHRYACYSTYKTRDGRDISIGAVENRFWKVLCEHLGKPEYTALQYDEGKREEIHEWLAGEIAQKTMAEWEEELGGLDVCFGPVLNLEETLEHPLFREREMVLDIDDGKGGKTSAIGVPVKLSETPGEIRTPPVGFGQSTDAILSEMGYSADDIKAFRDKGII
ncbi:MAG: CaiB/BaiF CoA transferase family protein [Desulfatibacillaceae bacterium]